MTRIYERFCVPAGYAGKIEGRSSFARLGLSVHCTGDFINPGWEGFMPLQLCNFGPYPIKLAPYFPVCQLMIVRLSSASTRPYGHEDLASKYQNDDGGPSLWWRDERVQALQGRLGQTNFAEAICQDLVAAIRWQSPEVVERFRRDVDRSRVQSVQSADQVLDDFARRERRRRLLDTVALGGPAAWLAVALTLVLLPFGLLQVVLIVVGFLTSWLAAAAWFRRDFGYFDPNEMDASFQEGL